MGTLRRLGLVVALLIALSGSLDAWIKGRVAQTFGIGRVGGLTLDGDLTDWPEDAFQTGPLAGVDGAVVRPDDFDVRAHVAWSDGSLWLGVEIQDDVIRDASEGASLDAVDHIRIRVADETDSRYLIATVAAAADPGAVRVEIDPRGAVQTEIEGARRTVGNRTTFEVRIPAEPFGNGRTLSLQVRAHDRDQGRDQFTAVWFPWDDLSVGGMSHRVRLSDRAEAPIAGTAHGSYPDLLETRVRIVCDASLADRKVTFLDGERELATGRLGLEDGRAVAVLMCEMPALGEPYVAPRIEVEGGGNIAVTIPDADERRAWRFAWHRITFRDYAFSGRRFPEARLEEPLLAEHLIGPYTVETTYYDRNYVPVERADADGRYGAVVTIRTDAGRVYRRFRTLYKFSGFIPWWEREVPASIELPEEFGIDPVVLDGKPTVVADQLKLMFWSGLSRDQRIGAFLAGLREAVPGELDRGFYDAVWERDRTWWVGLKRKLYGMASVDPIEAPVGVFKGRAQTLIAGSDAEAGFRAGAGNAIGAICQAWWEASDEPFTVCVARNGRVVHLKSYGYRDGRPVTLTTQVPIASITKLLTGVQMAIAVDQKRVDLDALIDTYLPAFRNVKQADDLTVRRLMNHTSGLEGHWGDEDNDFEEQIAGYLPEASIGRTYQYNGTGFAIAGKVIEAVSGEALPQFLRKHVLEPLGCEDTDVSGTSQDGQSTALDLARIGQLLLNGGAYGDFRFFEYEAMQELLPRPLSPGIPGTYRQYGMGTRRFPNEGLGEGTFGHGASSSTIFRVDPENKLVIVVARWAHGREYEQHKRKLFDTIVSHIEAPNTHQ